MTSPSSAQTPVPMSQSVFRLEAVDPSSWKDQFGRSTQHPAFAPNAVQKKLMDELEVLMQERGTTLSSMAFALSERLGVVCQNDQDRRDMESLVYHAKGIVQAKQDWKERADIAQALRLEPGVSIGTILNADGKRLNECRVVSVDEGGTIYKMEAQLGRQSVFFQIDAYALKLRIDRAFESGKRKTSFDELVQKRSTFHVTAVDPDPREPFYKSAEVLASDLTESAKLYQSSRECLADAVRWALRGGPGSFASLYSHVLHGKSVLANALSISLADKCHGGGPNSDWAAIQQQVDAARGRLKNEYQMALEMAFPDWEARLGLAEQVLADEARQEQEAQALREQERAAVMQAALAKAEVSRAARKIIDSIGEQAAKATLAFGEKNIGRGTVTRAYVDAQVAEVRADWAARQPDERTVELAVAIVNRDPVRLVQAWAQEGHGVSGVEGSMSAFRDITGLNLLRLSAAKRAQALYSWAGWSPARVEEQKKQMEAATRSQSHQAQVRQEMAARPDLVRRAFTVNAADVDGRPMPLKWLLDKAMSRGFKEPVIGGDGGLLLRHVATPEKAWAVPAGLCTDYVRLALRLEEEALQREDALLAQQEASEGDRTDGAADAMTDAAADVAYAPAA